MKQGQRKNIAIVFGTRPEVAKLAPLILELRQFTNIKPSLIATGQHDELLTETTSAFRLSLDYNLQIMQREQSLTQILTRSLTGLDKLYNQVQPVLTVVLGDTSSTFAAALASFYHRVPIAYVEAGMRSGRLYEPFPEEANRKLIASISQWFFPATSRARSNLIKEGYEQNKIFLVGTTEIDALLWMKTNTSPVSLLKIIPSVDKMKKIVVITTHRRESWGKPLQEVFYAIRALAQKHPNLHFIHSSHPNPIVYQTARKILAHLDNVLVLPHIEFLPFVHLLSRSSLIMTDSGGIQVDAAGLNKPVLILRNVTEWSEIVEKGIGRLVGTDRKTIIQAFEDWQSGVWPAKFASQTIYPPGAAQKIATILHKTIL